MSATIREEERGGFLFSSDPGRVDVEVVHGYLSRSYWAEGIPRETVERSIEGSMCFGVYGPSGQVGFARVVTDRATFGYLADVFILEEHRGAGLGKALMEFIMAHPDLQGLRRFMLCPRDAHSLYEKFGFRVADRPQNVMWIVRRGMYKGAGG